jgi:hypothetical protein
MISSRHQRKAIGGGSANPAVAHAVTARRPQRSEDGGPLCRHTDLRGSVRSAGG